MFNCHHFIIYLNNYYFTMFYYNYCCYSFLVSHVHWSQFKWLNCYIFTFLFFLFLWITLFVLLSACQSSVKHFELHSPVWKVLYDCPLYELFALLLCGRVLCTLIDTHTHTHTHRTWATASASVCRDEQDRTFSEHLKLEMERYQWRVSFHCLCLLPLLLLLNIDRYRALGILPYNAPVFIVLHNLCHWSQVLKVKQG